MEELNSDLQIAIIASASALLGSLIPTIISYLTLRKQNNFKLKEDLLKNQKEAYLYLMNVLQDIINEASNEKFIELQKCVILISIYGDNKTSISLKNYYNELTSFAAGKRGALSSEEHKQSQKDIINGIRTNLGLKTFGSFEIVGFNPKKESVHFNN